MIKLELSGQAFELELTLLGPIVNIDVLVL